MAVVENLESTLTSDGTLDAEINQRIQKTSVAYRVLEKQICANSNIIHTTKMNIYGSCILSVLLYSSEIWRFFRRYKQILENTFNGSVSKRSSRIPKQQRGCPRGVMVKAMDCGIVVREFVLQSR